ncbi:MAG: Mpo1-like protein [Polyangiaceae bacterium]|jgi:hypothetical protein
MSEKQKFGSFEEFWPYYVRAHSNKTNRRLHFVGTTLAMACVGGAALLRRPALLIAAPVVGYGFAWFGHFVFEKNIPATFGHPAWSFRADFVMWSKIANGTMDAEVERVMAEGLGADRADTSGANGASVEATAN